MDNTENKSSKIALTAIVGDKIRTRFMQAADVFEQSKVLANRVDIKCNKDSGVGIEEVITELKDLLSPKFIVSFIISEDKTVLPYINTEVRVISDGSKWGVLADWIREEYPHLEVITDEYKFIKEVKLK